MMSVRKNKRTTYTKTMMSLIVRVALVDMQFPFILALLGRDQIAETMGGLIVTEIIGVFLVYCVKSFFETKESEKVRMIEERRKTEISAEAEESEEWP